MTRWDKKHVMDPLPINLSVYSKLEDITIHFFTLLETSLDKDLWFQSSSLDELVESCYFYEDGYYG